MSIRFTIITSTLNVGDALTATAQSIRGQSHRNIQWIVKDGGSSDDTLAVANANFDVITNLTSEPDHGIYEAWNKALGQIEGDWILFLGAADRLHATDTLENASGYLSCLPEQVTAAYGDVVFVNAATGVPTRTYAGRWHGLDGPWILGRPYLPHNEGVFFRARLFKDGFRYNQKLKIAADTELMLRELLVDHGARIPLVVSDFDDSGISTMQASRLRLVWEFVQINHKLGLSLKRPLYQLYMICANLVRYVLLKLHWIKR